MTTLLTNCEPMHFKVKGFQLFKDRHGKQRCYHRASGTAIDLSKYPIGSEDLLKECARIVTLSSGKDPKPGTLGLLIKEFRQSEQWIKELRPKTQRWYNEAFDYLKPINDTQLIRFKPSLVVKIRDKAFKKKGWYFANQVKTTLSTVFSWGAERDYIEVNPAKQVKKIKRPKGLARANRPWMQDEQEIVLAHLEPHELPPFACMLYMGMDPCDVLALPKTKYKDGAFDFSRQKTGNPVWKPVPKALKEILDNMPAHDAITLFANSRGKPWTVSGLDSVWRKKKTKMEENGLISKGLTMKGLRHTHASMLREMGSDDRTIADSLGQKTEAMGRHYSRDADIKDKMQKVVKMFDKNVKPRKKSVKP